VFRWPDIFILWFSKLFYFAVKVHNKQANFIGLNGRSRRAA
jgi:hypothetical protein